MGRLDIEAVREEVHRFDELIIRGPSPSASIYVAVQLCISRKNPQSTWAFLRMLGAGNTPVLPTPKHRGCVRADRKGQQVLRRRPA